MIKALIATIGLAFSINAVAAPNLAETLANQQAQLLSGQVQTQGLNWKVGDQNNYKLDMGFIQGTMIMKLREIVSEGYWLDQDMDLGFAGKQQASILLDPNTGEIKKMIVNGQEQKIPENTTEIVEVTEDKITVPAGTFDCIHARLKDKNDGKETNAWINPQAIPLSGMLKTIQPSQFGNVTIVLTSFKKN